jgi:hypothetical protein
MSKGKRLSEYERGKIDAYRERRMTEEEIAAKIKRSQTVVNNYLRLGKYYGLKGKRGRKSTLTNATKRQINRLASNNSISAAEIKGQLNLPQHKRTIQRHLASNPTLRLMKLKKKPYLTAKHASRRLDWARSALNNRLDWDSLVWSDEKRFNLDGPDGFQYYWHDLRKDQKYLSRRQFGGKSIMVWAAIGSKGKTKIAFIEGKLNSKRYIEVLSEYLLPAIREIFGRNCKFQQDNPPVHTSKMSKKWFKTNKIDVIEWPAYSPDLSPIENVWGFLVRKVYANGQQYQSVEELSAAIKKYWKTISLSDIKKFVNSMPNRIYELISNKGYSIDY